MKIHYYKTNRNELRGFLRAQGRTTSPDVKLARHIDSHRPATADPKCQACRELCEAAGFKLTL